MALRGGDCGGHHIGPGPKHLQRKISVISEEWWDGDQVLIIRRATSVSCTFISGWRVFPSVERYSESATSDGRVKDCGRWKETWHGTGGAVFYGAQKHLWPLQCFVQAVCHLKQQSLGELIIYQQELMITEWKTCVFHLTMSLCKRSEVFGVLLC